MAVIGPEGYISLLSDSAYFAWTSQCPVAVGTMEKSRFVHTTWHSRSHRLIWVLVGRHINVDISKVRPLLYSELQSSVSSLDVITLSSVLQRLSCSFMYKTSLLPTVLLRTLSGNSLFFLCQTCNLVLADMLVITQFVSLLHAFSMLSTGSRKCHAGIGCSSDQFTIVFLGWEWAGVGGWSC